MENRNSNAAQEGQPTLDSSALELTGIPDIPNRVPGHFADVNGARIYYETFGSGAPLLLIHGGAATIESWFCQIPFLSERYCLIVPEARGHGRTPDAGGDIDFRSMAGDFAALLDQLGLKNVSILGWSDGGVTGLQIAMDRPDLVKKVVAFGTHSRPEGMTDEFRNEVEGATPENFPTILSEGYKMLSPDGPEHWPIIFSKLKQMWLTLPSFTDDNLRSVECPVLLLVAGTDIVRREESQRMASLIPDARLRVLENVSHFAPVEEPEIFNHVVVDFLAE